MPMATASCLTDSHPSLTNLCKRIPDRLVTGLVGCAVLIIFLHGCASTGRRSERFRPAPRAGISQERELPADQLQIGKPRRSYAPLQIPDPLPPEVNAEIDELKTRYPDVFQRGLNRGTPYIAEIQRMLREEGIPEDMVWLAMVESMFQINAVSPASAVGMWQFIPGTARLYGLRVDRYVDERRDWRKATRAAIAYLRDLHDQFNGNWGLAISGYNMGGNGMQRIVNAMGGETDFWKLVRTPPACNRMREETRKYYPRLLAYIIVSRNPEKYGFTRGTGTLPATEEVQVQGMYALADLEQALGLPPKTLEELNPDLVRKITPPAETWSLRVPKGNRERVLAALKNIQPRVSAEEELNPASSGYYTVRKGDTLSKIAARFNTTPEAIAKANKFRKHETLRVGRRLKIPGEAVGGRVTVAEMVEAVRTAEATKEASTKLKALPQPEPEYHSVTKGETLSAIARRYGTTVNQLIAWNGLNAKGTIYVGQRLKVGESTQHPSETPPSSGKGSGGAVHVVQSGETASAIAARYGISLSCLLEANNLKRNSVLRVGDRLTIPGKSDTQTAKTDKASETRSAEDTSATTGKKTSAKHTTEYVVKKGDTLSGIATSHGITVAALRAQNGMGDKDVLREGQKLIIPAAGAVSAPESTKAAESTAASERKIQHKVEAGQNPTIIARQYKVPLKDLFSWNGWNTPPVLKVGDTVTVYVRE